VNDMAKRGRKPGTPKTGGRKPGTPNKATLEIKTWADEFFGGPKYRKEAEARMLAGRAPGLELYLLQMRFGKPRETVDLHENTRETVTVVHHLYPDDKPVRSGTHGSEPVGSGSVRHEFEP
jgi:hypothetical protein